MKPVSTVTKVKSAPQRREIKPRSVVVALSKSNDPARVATDRVKLVAAVRAGLSATELGELKSLLDVSNDTLAPIVGMSKATLGRRRPEQSLTPEEGDRVVRYALLYAQALHVMGTGEKARQWLKSPQPALQGATPLDYALAEVGAREVEDLLGRIEYGVYT